jgi:hypothetical protein
VIGLNGQISRNGAPTIGFGETREEGEKKFYGAMIGLPFAGLVAGAAAGAVLGRAKASTAALGAVVGGLVGGAGGIVAARQVLKSAAPPSTAAASPPAAPGMGNPASENCIAKGGRVVVIETPLGQSGVCVFPDGSRCEEWRFFRGECAPGKCRAENGVCP